MVKELAWREGVQEGLAVEITCDMLSERYIVVKHFLNFPKREKDDSEGAEEVRRTRRNREDQR
jgi:hypothetical protein